jgi:hypothetical protein
MVADGLRADSFFGADDLFKANASHLRYAAAEKLGRYCVKINEHIDLVINKLTAVCFMIRSVRPYMVDSSMMKIYYSLFHSILSYGIVFWGQATNTKKLFMIKKKGFV